MTDPTPDEAPPPVTPGAADLVLRAMPRTRLEYNTFTQELHVSLKISMTLDLHIVERADPEALAAKIVTDFQRLAVEGAGLEPVIVERVRRAAHEAQVQGRREGEERGRREGRAELMREWQEAAANAGRLDTKGGLS